MLKIFHKALPIFDQLYIFQLFEYQIGDFLKWFIKHPFKRNLQKKHSLEFTSKIFLLLGISLILQIFTSIVLSIIFFKSVDIFLIFVLFLYVQILSPIFIIFSQLMILPLEIHQKEKIIGYASGKRSKLGNLIVVAITGSYAKTSTKNILYTLLWKDFRVVKTPKSFNTLISVARSMIELLKPNTEIFLAEMDAYHIGEIDKLAKLVKPNMGIITSIAPQHLERFGSMEKLAAAQFEIAANLPSDGVLFLNSSNSWIMKLEGEYSVQKVFFNEGINSQAYATDISEDEKGSHFKMKTKKGEIEIDLPLIGLHHISNFLAAASVAIELGLSLKTIAQRASLVLPTEHRLEIKKVGELTIIDNTYNTNPEANRASLKLLDDINGSKKIVITPGLIELGDRKAEENQDFAQRMSQIADEIIVVGENAKKYLLKGLKLANYPTEKIHLVESTQKGMELLGGIALPGTVVLIENDLPDQYF